MATEYQLDAVFRIIDKATGPMHAIEKQGGLIGNSLKKAELRLDAISRASKTMIKGVALGAFAALGAGITVATKQYLEFDKAITASGALFKDLDSTSASFNASMEAIGKTARGVAAVTEFNAVDTAGALQKMAYAGYTSYEAMELLAGTTDLATAAGTDLTTAVDIVTDALGAFNMSATASNLQRISDVMAKTASTANTSITDMFEAIKYAAPGFTAAGQSAEVLSSAIGTLANAGIKGSMAGTALQAVFTELGKTAKQAKLSAYGISVQDAAGNFLNLYDIMSQIEAKTATMGNAERAGFMDEIFGVRGGKAMNILLAQGSEAMKAYENELINAGGAAAQMAAIMRGSLFNQINVLKSGLTELGFRFVEAFKTTGSDALQKLISAVQSFDPTALINTLVVVVDGLGKLFGFLWKIKDILISVFVAVKSFQGIMLVWAAGMKVLAIAQGVLNAAMLASPITWIILGVVTLIGLTTLIILKWETVSGWLQTIGEGFKWLGSVIAEWFIDKFEKVVAFFGGLKAQIDSLWERLQSNPIGQFMSGFLTPLHNMLLGIYSVIDAFKNGGFVEGIKAIGKAILGFVLAPVQSLLNVIGSIPGMSWAKNIASTMESKFYGGGSAESPVTQGERMAYSREESVSDVNLNVAMAPGLTGSVSGKAPGVSIQTTSSGGFGR